MDFGKVLWNELYLDGEGGGIWHSQNMKIERKTKLISHAIRGDVKKNLHS